MSEPVEDFSKTSFVRHLVMPALLVFLLPVAGLFFFQYCTHYVDDLTAKRLIADVNGDQTLSNEDKAGWIRLFRTVPVSELIELPQSPLQLPLELLFDYATFRWMIRASWICIISGIATFVFVGLGVVVSRKSQGMQALALGASWQLLRLVSALQAIGQGTLIVAASFWVTAVLSRSYYPKLIVIAGILVLIGVVVVLKGIFARPPMNHVAKGVILKPEQAGELWYDLTRICEEVNTPPPDQIIAGINDSFFVSEQSITVGDEVIQGRSLYVNLSLLRHLHGTEADAVMAHEMAHFSGNDTAYTRKVGPLLARYDNHLRTLYEGGITRPIYSFMLCFRMMFELSLRRMSREREYRADGIAAEVTSPDDVISALMKISAFSSYCGTIQERLYFEQQALEDANISDQVEAGYRDFAASFVKNDDDLTRHQVSHPFDRHPSVHARAEAVGIELLPETATRYLVGYGDGRWFQRIPEAARMERDQWTAHEQKFRTMHAQSLPFRYLPETDEELAVVEAMFPSISFSGKKETMAMDCRQLRFSAWDQPLWWGDIGSCQLYQGYLKIRTNSGERMSIKLKQFGKQQTEIVQKFNSYLGRAMAAIEFQERLANYQESVGRSELASTDDSAAPDESFS